MPGRKTDTVTAIGVLFLGACLWAVGALLLGFTSAEDRPTLAQLNGLAVTVLGLAVVGWWILSFAAAILAEVLSRFGLHASAKRARRFSPEFMRRFACAVLGFNLLAAPVAHASTETTEGGSMTQVLAESTESSSTASPLWVAREQSPVPRPQWKPAPTPAEGSLLVKAERAVGGQGAGALELVVQPGESLWTIAARHLGPDASAASVAEAWPRWFEANKHTIGEDPNLLRPGQVLVAPAES